MQSASFEVVRNAFAILIFIIRCTLLYILLLHFFSSAFIHTGACVRVCVCGCVCVHMRVCVRARVWRHARMWVHMCVRAHAVHTCVCMRAQCVCAHMWARVCAHVCVCVHVCVGVCVCVY